MARRRRSRSSRRGITRGSFARPLSLLMPSAVGAAGALAVNGIINYAPIPDNLKAGNMLFLTRAAIALGLGMLGPKLPVVGKYARDAAQGALIVTMTDFGKVIAIGQGVNLSGLGYTGPARVMRTGQYLKAPGASMSGVAGVGQGRWVRR